MRLFKNGIGAIGLMKVYPLVENSVGRNKSKNQSLLRLNLPRINL